MVGTLFWPVFCLKAPIILLDMLNIIVSEFMVVYWCFYDCHKHLVFAGVGRVWPLLLGGQTQWTVGLVATLISISSIIAADTCAFVGGKVVLRN